MATSARRGAIWVCGLLLTAGCGADSTATRRGGSAAAGEAEATGAAAGAACDVPNFTQPCTACGHGRQTCTGARTWGACECTPSTTGAAGAGAGELSLDDPSVTPAGNLDQSLTFSWAETLDTSGTCEAGRYEGSFDGTYCYSLGSFGGGLGGGFGGGFGPGSFLPGAVDCGSSTGNPVTGLSPGGAPGLVFELTESVTGETFKVDGGRFEGSANGFIPFEADLENGWLDCATAKFTADIKNGQYTYAGQVYAYEGWLRADYNKTTHTLVNGEWEVWEPATFNMMGTGQMGAANWGRGTWTTKWVP